MSIVSGSLEQALDGMFELRPFPAAASRLMSACSDESVTVRELTEIIKHDAGLSVRLLRMANSPIYGFSGEIRSIDHATVVLGMRALRDLAVSTAVGDVFDQGNSESSRVRQTLWQHSLACGCVSRLMAEHVEGVVADEAFLAGVIHDIGKLFILDFDTEGYSELLLHCSLDSLVPAETERYGMGHTIVGKQCGQDWGLPDEIIDVIEFHHDPEQADFGGPLLDVVFAANHLSARWFQDAALESSEEELLQQARIELDPDSLPQIRELATESLHAMSEVCS